MSRQRWLIGTVLALVLALSIAAGFQLGPALVSAAQHQEQLQAPPQEEATPRPKANQQPRRALLGVQVVNGDGGARVEKVIPDSPAAKAGVQAGDVITAVNGGAVADARQLTERVAALKAGDKATLTVRRNGADQSIEVTLGAQPKAPRVVPQPPKAPEANPLGPLGGIGGLLAELRDIPADQRFEHLRGASFSFTDKNGNPITVNAIPAVVTAVTSDTVTLRANGGSADSTYRVGKTTRVIPGGPARLGETVKAQDQVWLIAREGSDEALAIQDLTAAKERRGLPQPKAFVRPLPGGGEFRGLVPEQFRERFNRELDGVQKHLEQLRQRLDQQPRGGL